MSKLPKGWEEVKLGDFCDILDNQRIPISSEKRAEIKGNIPYYGANGVQDYINDFIFNETLVLLAEDGGNFNDYQTRPIAYMIHGKSWVNNHTHVLRAKNGENYFLFYSLVNKDITSFINGGTRTKLNRGELVKIPIFVPPIEEQKKIADILSTVDKKIAFVEENINATEELKKGLMQKLLTEGIGHTEFKDSELGRIPESWEIKSLNQISDLTSSKRIYLSDYVDSGIPFFRGKEVSLLKNREKIEDLLFISENKYEEIKVKYGVPSKNDILITAVGTLANTYRVPNNDKFYFKDGNLIWLKDITENSIFIEYLMNFRKKDILDSASGSSQKALTIVQLKKLNLTLPPLEEQKQIAEILSTVDNKLENLKEKKLFFQELKKGLMQKLLTGEVRV